LQNEWLSLGYTVAEGAGSLRGWKEVMKTGPSGLENEENQRQSFPKQNTAKAHREEAMHGENRVMVSAVDEG
jgi:hypothetical protein